MNRLDEIAMRHDIEYGRARSHDDIQKADRKFMRKAYNEGFAGKAAAAAIGLKYGAEKVFGNIYGLNDELNDEYVAWATK